MSLNNRIINNAIKNFVDTPVDAPGYSNLTNDDDLEQFDASETKNIFGLHYSQSCHL